MNKYIGNFNFDFEINYDDFKFSEHTAKDNKDNEFDLKQIELKMPTSLFKSYITNWKRGDAYIMDGKDLHMTSNGSYEDKLTLIMTGLSK
jgi:hypothetical protein